MKDIEPAPKRARASFTSLFPGLLLPSAGMSISDIPTKANEPEAMQITMATDSPLRFCVVKVPIIMAKGLAAENQRIVINQGSHLFFGFDRFNGSHTLLRAKAATFVASYGENYCKRLGRIL